MFRSYDHLQAQNIYGGNYSIDNGSGVFGQGANTQDGVV
jgi:hypothetical protein